MLRLKTVKTEDGEASLVYTTADGEAYDFSGWRQGDWCWLLPSENNNDPPDTCVSSSRVRSLPMQSLGRGPKQEPPDEQSSVVTSNEGSGSDFFGWRTGDWCWLPSGSEDRIPNPVGSLQSPQSVLPKAEDTADMVGASTTDAEIKDELDPIPSLKTENGQSIPEQPCAVHRHPRRGTKRVLEQTETNYEMNHGDEMIKESELSNLETEDPWSDDSTYSSDDDSRRDDSEEDTSQMTRSIRSQEPESGRRKARQLRNLKSKAEWDEKFQLLIDYKQQHGSTCVRRSHPVLGNWIRSQRQAYKRGTLQERKIYRLESIGFVWDKFEDQWENMYQRLVAYKKKHNTTRVPLGYKEDPQLGSWVQTQRSDCEERHRVDCLNKIGFAWNALEEKWETMYQRLVAYKKKHNNTNVPQRYKEDPQLGQWVSTQRRGCEESDRIDRLNRIGFAWNALEEKWENMYQRLVAYKKKHNTTNVPRGYEEDPQLGRWVDTQRHDCEESDRIDRLNRIGFTWTAQEEKWENMYQRLVAYKKKHNNTNVPYRYKEDPQLGTWVSTQRRGCEDRDRIDRLNRIGFIWNATDY